MTDEHEIRGHFVAVLNQVLDAVYQAKQAAWSTTSPLRDDLRELVAFLIDRVWKVHGGRGTLWWPLRRRQLAELAPARQPRRRSQRRPPPGGVTPGRRITAIADDARARSAAIGGAPEAQMLSELAEGLETRTRRLQSS